MTYRHVYETPDNPPFCPACKIPFPWGSVACPDGRPGCAVAHYGWRPCKCGMTVRTSTLGAKDVSALR